MVARPLILVALGITLGLPGRAACRPARVPMAQSGRPALVVRLERNRIYAGESVLYEVELRNVRQPRAPDLGVLDADFDVVEQGDQSLNQHMVSIVNGRRTERSTFGHLYRYLLRPRRAGSLTLPALRMEVDGEHLEGRELSLEVVEPEEQDFAIIDVRADPPAVYPTQPFTVSLRIFVHTLPRTLEAYTTVRNPVDRGLVRRPPPAPALTIPWVDPPEGLESEDANKWLSAELSRDPNTGFSINDVRSRGDIFSFFDDRLAAFDLDGRPARPEDVADMPALRGKADQYWVYRLDRQFVPQRPGSHRFGPVLLKGDFVEGFEQQRLRWRSIYAVGKAAHVTVKAVPEEGKPEAFTGGVGAFDIRAAMEPQRCHVGDPLTLTLTVTGKGNLDEIGPLDLTTVEGLAERFRVYEATAETRGSARVFTYSLRPLTADLTELPRLPFAYFDVSRERYVTVTTDPIPIVVEEAARLDETQILRAPRETEPGKRLEEARGIFGNITDPRALRDERVPLAAIAIYLGCLLVAYLGLRVGVDRWRRMHQDTRQLRRRRAAARARERLEQARVSLAADDAETTAGHLRRVLCGFAADLEGLAEAGMTGREVVAVLSRAGLDGAAIEETGQLIDACEAVRFGAPPSSMAPLVDSAQRLLEVIVTHCRKRGLLR